MKFVEEYVEKSLLVEFYQGMGHDYQGWVKISRIPLTVDFLAGEKYYKLSPKSILELDGEIRCYYEGNSLDPNCAACKSLGRFHTVSIIQYDSYCNIEFVFSYFFL